MPRPVGASSYTARTYSEGTYVNGLWVEGTQQERTIIASIQPFTGADLLSLDEGLRSRRPVRVYTETRLTTAEVSKTPDEVYYEGEWYELELTEYHNSNAPISHGYYVAVKASIQ